MKLKTFYIFTIMVATLFSCENKGESVFTNKTYRDSLEQNAGGVLIRKIHYTDDLHSWIHVVKYFYKDKFGTISYIGSGSYYAEEPPNDEQLIRFGKWTVFKTSGDRDKDLIFINENYTKNWRRYEISPMTIEQSDLWKEHNIDSQIENWDTVSKVKEIDKDGNVTVLYTYAKKNRIFTFITGKRQIMFEVNRQTGIIEMTRVAEL